MTRGTVATAIAIADIVVYAILMVVNLQGPDADPVSAVLFVGAVASFSLMGALLVRRVPENPIGALLLATGTIMAVGLVVLSYASLGSVADPPWPGATLALLFGDVLYLAPFVVALIGIPLVFPDGRLPSPRFRWVIAITLAGMVSMFLAGLPMVVPDSAELAPLVGALQGVTLVCLIAGFAGALTAVSVRFRRGDQVLRQQVKWLLADVAVAALIIPLAFLSGSSDSLLALAMWLIGFLAFLGLPVAIGIAVLRYRLYEIDVIIRRALVYVPLTAIIAGIYAASVALFQRLLTGAGQSSDMAIVLTTLVVVVVFTPIKNAVQAIVDRRFKEGPGIVVTPAAAVSPAPAAAPAVAPDVPAMDGAPMSPAVAMAPANAVVDPTELLRKLAALRNEGVLTDDEFTAKKGEILARL